MKQLLEECTGTCKLSKVLDTATPSLVANRTASVVEEIQCDLITITCKKGSFQHQSTVSGTF